MITITFELNIQNSEEMKELVMTFCLSIQRFEENECIGNDNI